MAPTTVVEGDLRVCGKVGLKIWETLVANRRVVINSGSVFFLNLFHFGVIFASMSAIDYFFSPFPGKLNGCMVRTGVIALALKGLMLAQPFQA